MGNVCGKKLPKEVRPVSWRWGDPLGLDMTRSLYHIDLGLSDHI